MKISTDVSGYIGPVDGASAPLPTTGTFCLAQTIPVTPDMVGLPLTATATISAVYGYSDPFASTASVAIVAGGSTSKYTTPAQVSFAGDPSGDTVISVTMSSVPNVAQVTIEIGCVADDITYLQVQPNSGGETLYQVAIHSARLESNNSGINLLTDATFSISNQDLSGWSIVSDLAFTDAGSSFDNRFGEWRFNLFGLKITQSIPTWQQMQINPLPGVTVLQGTRLTAPLDSRGNGNPQDILPIGTNIAILLVTVGTDAQNNPINGYNTLAELGVTPHIETYYCKTGQSVPTNIPGCTVLQEFQTTAPIDTTGLGHPAAILPVGTTVALLALNTLSTPTLPGYVNGKQMFLDIFNNPNVNVYYGAPGSRFPTNILGLQVLQEFQTTAPVDARSAGVAHILPVGTDVVVVAVENLHGDSDRVRGSDALAAMNTPTVQWTLLNGSAGAILWYGSSTLSHINQYNAMINALQASVSNVWSFANTTVGGLLWFGALSDANTASYVALQAQYTSSITVDWDTINADLGGLVFFGSLSTDTRNQYAAVIRGYNQEYR